MLKDSETPRYAVRRTKRTYSAETKAELLAACKAPGASIAAIASSHGMNANVLHRWLKDSSHRLYCPGYDRPDCASIHTMTVTWPMSAASEFASWSASVLK
jgi:hypothetical protein